MVGRFTVTRSFVYFFHDDTFPHSHRHHPRSMHFGMPYSTLFPASITRHTYNLIVNVRASHYLVLLFSGVVPLLVYLF